MSEWPAVSAVVKAPDGSTHRVHNLPRQFQQLILLIERRLRSRVLKLTFKGKVLDSSRLWREAVMAFWVSHGRRSQARQVALMRSMATGLRKRRVDRVKHAAHGIFELAQRADVRLELLEFVGLENLVRALDRSEVRVCLLRLLRLGTVGV